MVYDGLYDRRATDRPVFVAEPGEPRSGRDWSALPPGCKGRTTFAKSQAIGTPDTLPKPRLEVLYGRFHGWTPHRVLLHNLSLCLQACSSKIGESIPLDIIGDSVHLFHANLFDLARQTARVLGCD